MTPFPAGDVLSYRQAYEPAMSITRQADADQYFAALVAYGVRRYGESRAAVERIERENLAYYAGYFDRETRLRVERLFRCAHPVFGEAREREGGAG